MRRAEEEQAQILVPTDASGRPEPLCAVYASSCLEAIRRTVETDRRKITDAFEGLRVIELSPADYGQYEHPGGLFANLNTEQDLARAILGPERAP